MSKSDFTVRLISELFESRTGQKLTQDRHWRIDTALSGVMRANRIASTEQLAQRLLLPESQELETDVVDALLNNETYFFRDRAVFDQLSEKILPELHSRRADDRRLAIWSAGCSTGQEALSLAMILVEQWARWAGWTIEIVATDVSHTAIQDAKAGTYSAFQVQRGLGVHQMLVHFEETGEGWNPSRRLQRLIRFEEHNVLEAPPRPGRFDLVLCRNVLLYFDGATRTRALGRLAEGMTPDGYLMLGGGESATAHSQRFVPCLKNQGFFRLLGASAGSGIEQQAQIDGRGKLKAGLGAA